MNAAHSPANSALSGNDEHLSVSRALGELQARRPNRVNAAGEVLFTLPVEGLQEFVALCGPSTLIALPLSAAVRASDIFALAADGEPGAKS